MTQPDPHFLDKLCTGIPPILGGVCLAFLENIDLMIKIVTFIGVGFSALWWAGRFMAWLYKVIICIRKRYK